MLASNFPSRSFEEHSDKLDQMNRTEKKEGKLTRKEIRKGIKQKRKRFAHFFH